MHDSSKKTSLVARFALGGMLTVFGLNGFLHFAPMPPLEGAAGQFMGGLAAAGYFFPWLKATEVLLGLTLLSGRYVPLALTVLAPITLNIVAFHAFLAPAGSGPAVAVLASHLVLAWAHRDAFADVLAARPTVAPPVESARRAAPVEIPRAA